MAATAAHSLAAGLAMQGEGGPLDDLLGHSITYRIAVGPRAGQELFTLQTVPARDPQSEQQGDGSGAANASGFSLHAGLDIQTHQRLRTQDRVPRWHHAHRAGAAGPDGKACSPRATT